MACLDATCSSCGEIWFSNESHKMLKCPKCGEDNFSANHDEFGYVSLTKYHNIVIYNSKQALEAPFTERLQPNIANMQERIATIANAFISKEKIQEVQNGK